MASQLTFDGYVSNTKDALLIFEGCRQRLLPKTTRRLQESTKEDLICSGAVFVFDEKESGIKRWTDGLLWSPSRISGNFLVYRELDAKGKKLPADVNVTSMYMTPDLPTREIDRNGSDSEIEVGRKRKHTSDDGVLEDKRLTAASDNGVSTSNLTSTQRFRTGGLCKKTISLAGLHLVAYYRIGDVSSGRLRTPSSDPELTCLELHTSFLSPMQFRTPPIVEQLSDGTLRYVGRVEGSRLSSVLARAGSSDSSQSRRKLDSSAYQSTRTGLDSLPLIATNAPSLYYACESNSARLPLQTSFLSYNPYYQDKQPLPQIYTCPHTASPCQELGPAGSAAIFPEVAHRYAGGLEADSAQEALALTKQNRRRFNAQSYYEPQGTISSPLNPKAPFVQSGQELFSLNAPAADFIPSSDSVVSSIQYSSIQCPTHIPGDYSFSSSMASVMASSIRSTPSPPHHHPQVNRFNLVNPQDFFSADTLYQGQLYSNLAPMTHDSLAASRALHHT